LEFDSMVSEERRSDMRKPMRRERASERGMALILAILALMLLTFLGLTLTVTTSTELQIATNYRWSQQALYNAEAGLEVAKRYLREVPSWGVFLPPPRVQTAAGPPAVWDSEFCTNPEYLANGPNGEASRTCELRDCDEIADAGYGVVLWDKTFTTPFQNFPSFFRTGAGPDVGLVAGTFTIWVRRPLERLPSGLLQERTANDRLLLTAEGTAPQTGTSDLGLTNRAVRYLEVALDRIEPSDCENRSGQIGGGPTGSGYDRCAAVTGAGILGGVDEELPGVE
jgi:hypothetical protein